MTDLSEAVAALRSAVASVSSSDDEALQGVLCDNPLGEASVVSATDGGVGHVVVDLDSPVALGELDATLGPAKRLPRRPSGGAATVQFDGTIPDEGSTGATVLAELDDANRVVRLVIRRDSF